MILSDYQAWTMASIGQKNELSPLNIYKACVISANNGIMREEERGLEAYAQELLAIRRLIKAGNFENAGKSLNVLEKKKTSLSVGYGDQIFLKGILKDRQGDSIGASENYAKSAAKYAETKDNHRLKRALINEKIASAKSLNCYLAGDLYVLEKTSAREGHFDLAGIVSCARAGELIVAGKYEQSTYEAKAAIDYYARASCPEDHAMALCMLTLSQALGGQAQEARATFSEVLIRDGKIKPYVTAIEAFFSGKDVSFPDGHALSLAQFKNGLVKKGSIGGKILSALQEGSKTRDELIVSVWGETALHPSYCNRLFSALNHLKKTHPSAVNFDGEKYSVSG